LFVEKPMGRKRGANMPPPRKNGKSDQGGKAKKKIGEFRGSGKLFEKNRN